MKKEKISVRHFLNKRTSPIKDNWPRDNPVNYSDTYDYYPIVIQVVFRRKVNSKKSLFFKFIKPALKKIFTNEYLRDELDLKYYPEIKEAFELESDNIKLAIRFGENIPKDKFTLSNFSMIHEKSSKDILEYAKEFLLDKVKLGHILLKINLQNLPFLIDFESSSFEEILKSLYALIKDLNHKNSSMVVEELEDREFIFNYLSSFNPNFQSTMVTPVLWVKNDLKTFWTKKIELLKVDAAKDKGVVNEKRFKVMHNEFDSLISSIDYKCNKDIEEIKKLLVNN